MNKKVRTAQQCGIVLMAVLFMIYGACRGEADMVLNKAVNICLECIGLG